MKVLEEKEEKIAPGTLLGTTHTYAKLAPFSCNIWVVFLFFLPHNYLFINKFWCPFLSSYVVNTGTQDKSGAKRVKLKRVSSIFREKGEKGFLCDDIDWWDNMFHVFQVDLLRGQKSDKVDVTLLPEELDAMENVLPAKYEFFFFWQV